MHTFNKLHENYHGSPPPRLRPHRFGSWLLYYDSSTFLVPCAYNSPQKWVIFMRGELDRIGSMACGLILRSTSPWVSFSQQLTKSVRTVQNIIENR
jgi:hypothetical protein